MEQLKQKVQKEKSLERNINRLENKVKDEQNLDKALAQLEKKRQSSSATGTGTGSGGPGTSLLPCREGRTVWEFNSNCIKPQWSAGLKETGACLRDSEKEMISLPIL